MAGATSQGKTDAQTPARPRTPLPLELRPPFVISLSSVVVAKELKVPLTFYTHLIPVILVVDILNKISVKTQRFRMWSKSFFNIKIFDNEDFWDLQQERSGITKPRDLIPKTEDIWCESMLNPEHCIVQEHP